jgi:ABC-type multidrug transport system permease subunit
MIHTTGRPPAVDLVPGRGAGRGIAAILARDLSSGGVVRMPLLLDLLFGVVNLVVFLFISRIVTVSDGAALTHSVTYFDFAAVGITFMLIVQAASMQLITKVVREQRDGTLEMLAVQPLRTWELAVGMGAYPILVGLLRAGIYLAILSLLLGLHVGRASWWGVAVVLIASSAAVLGIGITLAAVALVISHGGGLARVVVVGLSFVSGTYFPATSLPPGVEHLSAVLPTRIALDGLRAALAGGRWAGAAAILLVASLILLPLSIWIFGRALKLIAHRGTMSHD